MPWIKSCLCQQEKKKTPTISPPIHLLLKVSAKMMGYSVIYVTNKGLCNIEIIIRNTYFSLAQIYLILFIIILFIKSIELSSNSKTLSNNSCV